MVADARERASRLPAFARTPEFALHVLALSLVGAYALLVKWLVLDQGAGFLVVTRALGLDRTDELSPLQRASLFRSDVLLHLVVLPLLLPIVCHSLWRRGARYVIACVAIAVALVLYSTQVAFGNVGTFLSFDMLVDAVRWGVDQPHAIGDYIGWKGAVVISALIAGVVVLSFGAKPVARVPMAATLARAAAVAALLVGLVATAATHVAQVPGARQGKPVLFAALSALSPAGPDAGSFAAMDRRTLQARFRSITATPPWTRTPYFGLERDSDVLVFVFETGPSRAFNRSGGLETLPTLSRLARRSFVATRHHTTFPYTSDAVFSILSGLYPIAIRARIAAGTEALPEALPAQLKARGYATARYAYSDSFEADATTFRHFGVTELFEGDRPPPGVRSEHPETIAAIYERFGAVSERDRRGAEYKLNIDCTSLEKLKSDLASLGEGSRYFKIYLPVIGHAPWSDFGGQTEIEARGRKALEIQDAWLGEIVDILEKMGRLERTVIVATADHGIRTVTEDRAFDAGRISDYSFEVPLLVYAPRALQQRVTIDVPTSHVDVAPTVLELLGVRPADPNAYQGVPVFSRGLERRKLFFFARGYLGADGLLSNGRYFMRSSLTGLSYANDRMQFPETTVVDDPSIGAALDEIYALEARWARIVSQRDHAR